MSMKSAATGMIETRKPRLKRANVELPLNDPRNAHLMGSRLPKDVDRDTLLGSIMGGADLVEHLGRMQHVVAIANAPNPRAVAALEDIRAQLPEMEADVAGQTEDLERLVLAFIENRFAVREDADALAAATTRAAVAAAKLMPAKLKAHEYERRFEAAFKTLASKEDAFKKLARGSANGATAGVNIGEFYAAMREFRTDGRTSAPEDLPMPKHGYNTGNPRLALLLWGAWMMASMAQGRDPEEVTKAVYAELTAIAKAVGDEPDRGPMSAFAGVASLWASVGFPCLAPTHKLAKSLMATSMPKEYVVDLKLPWPCFMIQVPDGILKLGNVEVKCIAIIDLHDRINDEFVLGDNAKRYSVFTFCDDGSSRSIISLHQFESFDQIVDKTIEVDLMRWKGVADLHTVEDADAAGRVWMLINRLLIGSIVEMDSEEKRKLIEAGPPAARQNRPSDSGGRDSTGGRGRASGLDPKAWIFELRRDVKVDCGPFITEFLERGGRSPTVQILVRGHHKRQPHGKGGLLRKWIHVEPYWKGPADAPIAVRMHKVGEK